MKKKDWKQAYKMQQKMLETAWAVNRGHMENTLRFMRVLEEISRSMQRAIEQGQAEYSNMFDAVEPIVDADIAMEGSPLGTADGETADGEAAHEEYDPH